MARKPRNTSSTTSKGRGGRKKANGGDEPVFDKTAAGAQDNGAGPQAGPGDNSGAIADVVEEAKRDIRAAIAARDSFLAQAKALQRQASAENKKIAKAYGRIKTVAGIDRVQMERALELEDMEPEARQKALEQQALAYHLAGLGRQFADAYAAAAPGEQIDMLKVAGAEPAAPKPDKSGSSFNAQAAESTGYADGKQGKRTNADAYTKTAYMADYERGYLRGTAENLPEKGTPAPAAAPGDPFGPAEATVQ
jgi:hypothetical protein